MISCTYQKNAKPCDQCYLCDYLNSCWDKNGRNNDENGYDSDDYYSSIDDMRSY